MSCSSPSFCRVSCDRMKQRHQHQLAHAMLIKLDICCSTQNRWWHQDEGPDCKVHAVCTVGAGSSSSAMGSSVQMWAMRDARSWLRSLTARARICTPANPSYEGI